MEMEMVSHDTVLPFQLVIQLVRTNLQDHTKSFRIQLLNKLKAATSPPPPPPPDHSARAQISSSSSSSSKHVLYARNHETCPSVPCYTGSPVQSSPVQ